LKITPAQLINYENKFDMNSVKLQLKAFVGSFFCIRTGYMKHRVIKV